MNRFPRTFRLDRLYYQFLRPNGMPLTLLQDFASRLEVHGFIRLNDDGERYSETDRLSGGHHQELFRLITTMQKTG